VGGDYFYPWLQLKFLGAILHFDSISFLLMKNDLLPRRNNGAKQTQINCSNQSSSLEDQNRAIWQTK